MNHPGANAVSIPADAGLLAQLRDIKGLDSISAWPPGAGWWILLALIIGALLYYVRRRAYIRSWKGDARRTLEMLEKNMSPANTRECVDALSMILRRIAMKRFSREACAGLEGQGWLDWLKANDPRGFDWAGKGLLLVKVPYAPPGRPVNMEKIRELIDAAKAWVK